MSRPPRCAKCPNSLPNTRGSRVGTRRRSAARDEEVRNTIVPVRTLYEDRNLEDRRRGRSDYETLEGPVTQNWVQRVSTTAHDSFTCTPRSSLYRRRETCTQLNFQIPLQSTCPGREGHRTSHVVDTRGPDVHEVTPHPTPGHVWRSTVPLSLPQDAVPTPRLYSQGV